MQRCCFHIRASNGFHASYYRSKAPKMQPAKPLLEGLWGCAGRNVSIVQSTRDTCSNRMQVANTPRRNSTEIPAEFQFPSKSRVKQIQRFTWRYNFVDEGHNSSRPQLHFHQLISVWPLTMGLDGSDELDDLPFKLELIQRDTQSISNPSPSFHPRIGSLSSVGRWKMLPKFPKSHNLLRPVVQVPRSRLSPLALCTNRAVACPDARSPCRLYDSHQNQN